LAPQGALVILRLAAPSRCVRLTANVSRQDMRFEREGCKAVERPTEAQIRRGLSLTKSSFASLTAQDGSYLQVAGGPGLFALEFRSASGQHFRGRQHQPVVRFEDGTTLMFSGGTLTLEQCEWFLIDQVAEVFRCFAKGENIPVFITWQPLNAQYLRAR
jgi:hypothetical protein